MDGVLVIDKPAGPTSHDVVARVRRILRERRVGHTGTLDPMATGVLPLVVGRATRLARFLSASEKTYEAVIALGFATDTGDSSGAPIGDGAQASPMPLPPHEAIDRALDEFRGTFLQPPPLYSAKKIGGERSYRAARRTRATLRVSDTVSDTFQAGTTMRPLPVEVTVHRLVIVAVEDNRLTVSLDCSAGFYVRSLAHDLGERLGTGAHLAGLRRTRSADYTLDDAIPLEDADRDPAAAGSRLIPLSRMLQRLPAVALTAEGVRRARHGQDVRPADVRRGFGIRDLGFGSESPECEYPIPRPESLLYVRLLDPAGDLIGIAEPSGASGLLHPSVVLG